MLGALIGLLLPSPIQAAKAAVEPNPYAPDLPLQFSVAVGQYATRGIRGGLSELPSGSEADYQLEQISGSSAIGVPLRQFIPDAAQPPSRFTPRLPDAPVGRGTGPQTGAYNKGWVTHVPGVPVDDRRWGWLNRGRPNVINGTLLDPLDRAPVPRDLQAAYTRTNPNELRLEDQYGVDE